MLRSGFRMMPRPGLQSVDMRARAGLRRKGLEEMVLMSRERRRFFVGRFANGEDGSSVTWSFVMVRVVEARRTPRRHVGRRAGLTDIVRALGVRKLLFQSDGQ